MPVKIVSTNLINAIDEKRVIMFTYKGVVRIVKPFIVGMSTRGNLLLSGFQIGGKASSGIVTGWKYFEVAGMRNVTIFSRTSGSIPSGYNRNDRQFKTIWAQR